MAKAKAQFNWRTFLEEYNQELLADPDLTAKLPKTVVKSGWLGFDGATESQIKKAEKRLGCKLPPSYREFLKVSNGWRYPSSFIYDLFPVEKLQWFQKLHGDWIETWVEGADLDEGEEWPEVSDKDYFVYGPKQDRCNFRLEYWRATLTLSGRGDSAVYLLNPLVVSPEGEWEAWFFSTWGLGASRYRSFQEMLIDDRATFGRLRLERIKQRNKTNKDA